jgi:hypothetical protein
MFESHENATFFRVNSGRIKTWSQPSRVWCLYAWLCPAETVAMLILWLQVAAGREPRFQQRLRDVGAEEKGERDVGAVGAPRVRGEDAGEQAAGELAAPQQGQGAAAAAPASRQVHRDVRARTGDDRGARGGRRPLRLLPRLQPPLQLQHHRGRAPLHRPHQVARLPEGLLGLVPRV